MKKLIILFVSFLGLWYLLNADDSPCKTCYGFFWNGGPFEDSPTGEYCYADTQSGPDECCGPMIDCKLGWTGCSEYHCNPPCYVFKYDK